MNLSIKLNAVLVDDVAVVLQVADFDGQAFVGALEPGDLLFRGIELCLLGENFGVECFDVLFELDDVLVLSASSELLLLDVIDLLDRIFRLSIEDAA